MSVQEFGDRGFGEQGDLRLGKALPDGHQRRRCQDRVTYPVRRADQDPLHRPGPGQPFMTTRIHSSNPSYHCKSIRTAHSATCWLFTSSNCPSFTASFSVVTIRSTPD